MIRYFFFLIISTIPLSAASAKPMLAPSIEDACNSHSVVEAEYLSYRPQKLLGEIKYFTPPMAQFRVIKKLRGSDIPEYILVRYDFDDGSACLTPPVWTFSSTLMPKKNSRWILFLQTIEDTPAWFQTYRGDYGRMTPGEKSESTLKQCDKITTR